MKENCKKHDIENCPQCRFYPDNQEEEIRETYNTILSEDELLNCVLAENKIIESSFYLYKLGYKSGRGSMNDEFDNIKEWNIKIVKKKNEQMKAMECCGNCNEWSAFKASCGLGMYGVVGKCSNWEINNSNK